MFTNEVDKGVINVTGQSTINLGRSEDGNQWVLPHPAVSAHHACLELRSDNQWWIMDLKSEHGTYVNNQRVGEDGLPLMPERDTLWIAPYALRLSIESENLPPHPTHFRLDLVNLQRQVNKKILLDLSGTPLSFRPGEFIAIVGGSGAGKSTLLKALLGVDTIKGKGRFGDVYFNNQLLIHDDDVHTFAPLNTIVGYVPQQDDSIHQELSAREALDYTTRLRFSSDISKEERFTRIQNVLESVKLDREDLQTRFISQLSGGQRKRVNIAMELIADPRLLFLDEPTSGLDPGLDLEMMNLLKRWTIGDENNDPKTIVLITHATENVKLCDYIVFLGLTQSGDDVRGGRVLYFGSPGEDAETFFGKSTFSEIYQVAQDSIKASELNSRMMYDPEASGLIWERARTPDDIENTKSFNTVKEPSQRRTPFDFQKTRHQFRILSRRYLKLLWRDRGAFLFQLLQGAMVALLLWGVAAPDALSISGVREAPTTLFILSIAATWLGILNATKEIVKEKRVFGRERRYGVGVIPYVVSKFSILGLLGLWQMGILILVTILRFEPEQHIGTFGRGLPESLQLIIPLEIEWFITLELMLLAGVSLGLLISSIAKSLNQATMLMFPAMLIQILLAGILFDVGPFAWISFTHWGLQALGNSLNLAELFSAAGKAGDPILDILNLTGNVWTLLGEWLILLVSSALLIALTCWRQSMSDKARIPEE